MPGLGLTGFTLKNMSKLKNFFKFFLSQPSEP
jgi:hypothetical protein